MRLPGTPAQGWSGSGFWEGTECFGGTLCLLIQLRSPRSRYPVKSAGRRGFIVEAVRGISLLEGAKTVLEYRTGSSARLFPNSVGFCGAIAVWKRTQSRRNATTVLWAVAAMVGYLPVRSTMVTSSGSSTRNLSGLISGFRLICDRAVSWMRRPDLSCPVLLTRRPDSFWM